MLRFSRHKLTTPVSLKINLMNNFLAEGESTLCIAMKKKTLIVVAGCNLNIYNESKYQTSHK